MIRMMMMMIRMMMSKIIVIMMMIMMITLAPESLVTVAITSPNNHQCE